MGSLEGGDSGQDYAHNDGVNLVDSSSYIAFMWRRAPKFFDYVRYDGNGSNRTIEHALGVTPEMILVKNMTAYGQDWGVYYGDATDYLWLHLLMIILFGMILHLHPLFLLLERMIV